MSNKPQSRKRKFVDGNLQEIKKQEEVYVERRVGETSNFITRLFRKLRKIK